MDRAHILNQRLFTQGLAGCHFAKPGEAVRSLVALQSQDYGNARWSVGQRVADCKDADVARAFDEGTFLRTHVLRPTWHFVMPDDIRWLLDLTAPRVHILNGTYYRRYELDDATFARCEALFGEALHGGNHLTRSEMARLLGRHGIDVADRMRLGLVLMHAELEAVICSGGMPGKQQTYALVSERAPNARRLPRDDALAELTRRFFEGHGPATLKNLVRWSGLTVADARAGLERVKCDLARVELDGETFWCGSDAPTGAPPPGTAFLLPEYDECWLTYPDLNFPDLPAADAKGEWADVFYRPLIIDGKRAGSWRRTVGRDDVRLDVDLFAALGAAQMRALEAAVDRYRAFMDMPVNLAIVA